MLNDKQIKSLPTREMIRCEVSGKLVPLNECEVVVIKIIKHKDVDLNGYNPFNNESKEDDDYAKKIKLAGIFAKPEHVEKVITETKVDKYAGIDPDVIPKPIVRRAVIPAAILSTMTEPGFPGEAIERRIA